jgi:hypothetical protein
VYLNPSSTIVRLTIAHVSQELNELLQKVAACEAHWARSWNSLGHREEMGIHQWESHVIYFSLRSE